MSASKRSWIENAVAESRTRRPSGRVGEELEVCVRRCAGRSCRMERREVEEVGWRM